MKKLKILMVVLSLIIVMFSLTGNIITTSVGGSVSLLKFESFFVYIIAIVVALYMIFTDKNANIAIFVAILTYAWTYYLIQQMIDVIIDIKINITPTFYIYLSSVIFLIISLFINDKKQSNILEKSDIQKSENNLPDENSFIFTNFISGIKEISLDTIVLIVNNFMDNSLDCVYSTNNQEKKTIKIPISAVTNITFIPKVRMQNIAKKPESNEVKSALLSAVVFGGNPLLQLAGATGFNNLFNSVSNNYDKINYSEYYEIIIMITMNNEDMKLILTTDTNPEQFIKKLLSSENNNI